MNYKIITGVRYQTHPKVNKSKCNKISFDIWTSSVKNYSFHLKKEKLKRNPYLEKLETLKSRLVRSRSCYGTDFGLQSPKDINFDSVKIEFPMHRKERMANIIIQSLKNAKMPSQRNLKPQLQKMKDYKRSQYESSTNIVINKSTERKENTQRIQTEQSIQLPTILHQQETPKITKNSLYTSQNRQSQFYTKSVKNLDKVNKQSFFISTKHYSSSSCLPNIDFVLKSLPEKEQRFNKVWRFK